MMMNEEEDYDEDKDDVDNEEDDDEDKDHFLLLHAFDMEGNGDLPLC